MQNIFVFLLLVSISACITEDPRNDTENIIPSGLWLKNNTNKIQSKNFTTANEDENHNANELRKLVNEKNEGEAEESTEENKDISLEQQRKSRDSDKKTSNLGIECVSCYSSGLSISDENCYKGVSAKTQKCTEVEQCFTELHPQYIKRGCMLPSSINRTFVCKCPLCNDKPSEDSTYYEYRTISDWEYDNKRLQEPVVGLDLLCKVCETRGTNIAADKICKLGRNADYMQCPHGELCYTNIDHQIEFVSRGCTGKPAFNALYFFCNESRCNSNSYPHPRTRRSQYHFKIIPMVKVTSLGKKEASALKIQLLSILASFFTGFSLI